MPPIKDKKAVDAGAGYDQMAHVTLADVRLAGLRGERNPAANHHPRADAQIFHDRVMDRSRGVIEENIDAFWTGLLHRGGKVGRFLVVDPGVEADFAAPLKFAVVAGDRHRTTSRQLGDLADELADGSGCRGYDDCIGRPWLGDVEKPEGRGQAKAAEPRTGNLKWRQFRIHFIPPLRGNDCRA